MKQLALGIISAVALTCGLAGTISNSARAQDSGSREIPTTLAPLEYLVGSWVGQARPKERSANQFRGWQEMHTWAWTFAKGKPVGLNVSIEGGKTLTSGKLRFDAQRARYRLEASGPAKSSPPLIFEGAFDATGKLLVLDQVGLEAGSPRLRISLRPNANFIRYTMMVDRKESAVQFSPLTEVGLTRKGESLAGAAAAAEGPKCIVTGGAANMTLTYQGRSFPICCSGCRDEFNDNPEKYMKKASLLLSTQPSKSTSERPRSAGVSRSEDDFASDVSPVRAADPGGMTGQAKAAAAKSALSQNSNEGETSAKAGKEPAKKTATKAVNRAASQLRIAQNLEKIGKNEDALKGFKQIVKDYPGTPAAKTAAARIKALESQ